jgi:hypothetical protein
MFNIKEKTKLQIIRVFLWINGILLIFWWPLAHWFYSDFYHQLLGFKIGSYADNMVKIIGTCGFIPVLLIIFCAINPIKNRDIVITLIIFGILLCITYIYNITINGFPMLEYFNAGFSLFSALFLILFYPWK